MAYFLEALTIVECAEDAIERVPVLLGAASTLREATENKTYGYYRPDDSLRRDVEDRARQVLRDGEYADAFETGRILPGESAASTPSVSGQRLRSGSRRPAVGVGAGRRRSMGSAACDGSQQVSRARLGIWSGPTRPVRWVRRLEAGHWAGH